MGNERIFRECYRLERKLHEDHAIWSHVMSLIGKNGFNKPLSFTHTPLNILPLIRQRNTHGERIHTQFWDSLDHASCVPYLRLASQII